MRLFSITGQEIIIHIKQKGFSHSESTLNYTIPEAISKELYLLELEYDNKKIIKKLILE